MASKERHADEYLILLRHTFNKPENCGSLLVRRMSSVFPSAARRLPLLATLGYDSREPCGARASLETAESRRAFLTVDSGFPLADLEQMLQGRQAVRPFVSQHTRCRYYSARPIGRETARTRKTM